MADLRWHVVVVLVLVFGIFAHVSSLVLSSESHLVWKIGALAQLYHDAFFSERRYTTVTGWARGSASRIGAKKRGKDSNVVPIEVNRQFEIVSVESPIHSEYIKCCPEGLSLSEVDYVCTCASEEGEENGYVARIWTLDARLKEKYASRPQKRSSWSLEVTPIEEIKDMAGQVFREMKEAEQAMEDVFNTKSYTQFEWFLQNKDNLGSVRDTMEAAANAHSNATAQAAGLDPDLVVEQRSTFELVEKKFHAWCEEQESKDLIERRFYMSDGIREDIFNRTRCEADEYDLDQGCARDPKKNRGRATNNGILEAELAEKAKMKPKYRYESVVTLRADQKVDAIMQSLAEAEAEAEGGDKIEDEEEDNTAALTDAADHPKLVKSFESLDQIKRIKGEDLVQLVETCLATKRMAFLELFVTNLEEEVARDEEAKKEAEDAKKKAEDAKKKAAEAKKKADDAKKRSRSRRRKGPEPAAAATQAPVKNDPSSTSTSNSGLSASAKANVTQERNASATTAGSSTPARRGQAERSRNRNRGKRARSRSASANTAATNNNNNSQNATSNSTTNSSSSSIPSGSSPTQVRQYKRAKQRELKKGEELCHTLYQSALKIILTAGSNRKGLHSQLLLAETDKQTCLRRVRKKIAYDIESIGKDL